MPTTTGSDPIGEALAENVAALITTAAAQAPRSLQRRIGPSEVGEPCDRKLTYKILEWPSAAADGDPIASVLGTAFHAWMEDAFGTRQAVTADGRPRYRIEERVTVRDGLTGSSDLYDRATGTVYDWKLVGVSSLDNYRRKGPGDQYRVQAHLYGLGQENAGEKPERVAIVFVGRYHELRVHVWTEPYDRQVAIDALARLDRIRHHIADSEAALSDFGHAWWSQISTSDTAKCRFCPWLNPGSTDLTAGCPGTSRPTAGASLESLIA